VIGKDTTYILIVERAGSIPLRTKGRASTRVAGGIVARKDSAVVCDGHTGGDEKRPTFPLGCCSGSSEGVVTGERHAAQHQGGLALRENCATQAGAASAGVVNATAPKDTTGAGGIQR